MRQPRKICTQAKKEDHIIPNKVGAVPLKCDHTGEVEWKRGRREDGWLHGHACPEEIRRCFMRQMGKWSGTAGHSCGAAKELHRQTGNAWWMYNCHWQLWLTHQPEGNCTDRPLSVQQAGQALEQQYTPVMPWIKQQELVHHTGTP